MKRHMGLLLVLWTLTPAHAGSTNRCNLPRTTGAGGGISSNQTHSVVLSVVSAAGIAQSTAATLGIGPQFLSRATYRCFLGIDIQLFVEAFPGSLSTKRNVPTKTRSMTLEWSGTAENLQITYSVYVGTSSMNPTNVVNGLTADQGFGFTLAGLTPASYDLEDIEYLTPYYWRVVATDQFGRTAESPIYAFSIAPAVDHMIAAPNPFHPGRNTTTLMFSMPGAGSALLEIFSLPDAYPVLRTSLDGLFDGVNTYTYDGRDAGGRWLPNGVYVLRLKKNGAKGNDTETFKLVSAR